MRKIVVILGAFVVAGSALVQGQAPGLGEPWPMFIADV